MSPKRRDVVAVVALVVIAGGVAVGAMFAANAARSSASGRPATVTKTLTETITTTMPASPTLPVTKTITVTPTTTSVKPPGTAFANGSFMVGFDVLAGSYRTEGSEPGSRTGCVWQRLHPGGPTIAQGTTFGPLTINVRNGELVTATGCQKWTNTES